jgi:hypothetical protein
MYSSEAEKNRESGSKSDRNNINGNPDLQDPNTTPEQNTRGEKLLQVKFLNQFRFKFLKSKFKEGINLKLPLSSIPYLN